MWPWLPKLLAGAMAALTLSRLSESVFLSPLPSDRNSLQLPRSHGGISLAASTSLTTASQSTSSWLPAGATAALALCLASRFAATRSRSKILRRANLVATRPDQAIPWWDRMSKWTHERGMGIWAEKFSETQLFVQDGGNVKKVRCTVLVIKRGGNLVTDKYWPEKHGYYAVEVGYERFTPDQWEMKTKRRITINRLMKNECPPLRKVKQFKVRPKDWVKYEIGQKVWPTDLFKTGDMLDITGKGIQKGFLGAIQRWHNHHTGPMTHGSKHHRRYGSVGAGNGRILKRKKMPGWTGGRTHTQRCKVMQIMDRIDEDNMPESIIVIKGRVPGYCVKGEKGGSYVYLTHKMCSDDGRYDVDPVYMWYFKKGEGSDPFLPLKHKTWSHKTFWGRDVRWIAQEKKKYWPDGYPGYDNRFDPFHDDCDPHLALKVPEW